MKIKSIKDLKPDPKNANKGTDRGRKAVAESLAKYGAGRSILADKHGRIVAGNKTFEAASKNGGRIRVVETDGEELVVVQRTDLDLDSKKGRELAIADNRSSEVGLEWDPGILKELDADLSQFWNEGELRKLIGLTSEEGEPPAQIDRAGELQKKWKVEQGQLWKIGEHRLLCGDSSEESQRMLLMQGQIPDLMNTDPPYGISIVSPLGTSDGSKPFGSTGGTARRSSHGFDAARVGPFQRGPKSKNQIIQSTVYPVIHGDQKEFDPTPYLDLAKVVVLWGANYFAQKLPHSACWICWDKRENLTRNTFADCELAWLNQSSPARIFYHLWSGLYKGSQYGERRTHPTEKPVALFREIGLMYAPQGVWLDLFAGTGAQIIAAEQVKTRCLAAEWEPLYVAVTLERLSDLGLTPELVSH